MVPGRPEYKSVFIKVQKTRLKHVTRRAPTYLLGLLPGVAEGSPEMETTSQSMTWKIRIIEIDPEQSGR